MITIMTTLFFWCCLCLFKNALGGTEPDKYILSFPTTDNPMKMKVITPVEMNYFITLGDWGAATAENDGQVQRAIAAKMNAYYESQASKGYNLLGVFAVGDNFYYTGQDCKSEFSDHWLKIYGTNLTSVPWLAVYGNHDWGNSDEYAMCAWNAPNPYINPTTNIPYNAHQLNSDKHGCNPSTFYIPDFGYYYSLNELNFELIALDQSTHDCPGGIGGGYGNDKVFKNCGSEKIGCAYLQKIATASEQMMVKRANISNNTNFIISQHYPSQGNRLLNTFKSNRKNNGKDDTIWSIFGHTHKQECTHKDANNVCDEIMTGGGGGCCVDFTLRGFYVIGFDKDANIIQPLQFNDPAISCQYPCSSGDNDSGQLSVNDIIERGLETCCHTMDVGGIDCDVFDQHQCKNIN